WKTTAEINSKGFDVLRLAADGSTWEKIGFVSSANSSTAVTYNFTDRLPLPGVNTYRLRQVDLNGDYKLSSIIALNFKLDRGLISIYPNPVKDKVGIVFSDNNLKNTLMQISTVTGTVISK